MKIHITYIALVLIVSVCFYVLGQYVGIYKMQAHVYVVDQAGTSKTTYKFETVEERLAYCEERVKQGNLSFLRDYEWYQAHWSFSFPDVQDLDERTKSFYLKNKEK